VAYCRELVEKAARARDCEALRVRAAPNKLALVRLRATSIIKGFVLAIVSIARGGRALEWWFAVFSRFGSEVKGQSNRECKGCDWFGIGHVNQ
jgi:hypothetical protein